MANSGIKPGKSETLLWNGLATFCGYNDGNEASSDDTQRFLASPSGEIAILCNFDGCQTYILPSTIAKRFGSAGAAHYNHEKSLFRVFCDKHVHMPRFCICDKPYERQRFMVCCDDCGDWFHAECVGISNSETSDDHFTCPRCKQAKQQGRPVSEDLRQTNLIKEFESQLLLDGEDLLKNVVAEMIIYCPLFDCMARLRDELVRESSTLRNASDIHDDHYERALLNLYLSHQLESGSGLDLQHHQQHDDYTSLVCEANIRAVYSKVADMPYSSSKFFLPVSGILIDMRSRLKRCISTMDGWHRSLDRHVMSACSKSDWSDDRRICLGLNASTIAVKNNKTGGLSWCIRRENMKNVVESCLGHEKGHVLMLFKMIVDGFNVRRSSSSSGETDGDDWSILGSFWLPVDWHEFAAFSSEILTVCDMIEELARKPNPRFAIISRTLVQLKDIQDGSGIYAASLTGRSNRRNPHRISVLMAAQDDDNNDDDDDGKREEKTSNDSLYSWLISESSRMIQECNGIYSLVTKIVDDNTSSSSSTSSTSTSSSSTSSTSSSSSSTSMMRSESSQIHRNTSHLTTISDSKRLISSIGQLPLDFPRERELLSSIIAASSVLQQKAEAAVDKSRVILTSSVSSSSSSSLHDAVISHSSSSSSSSVARRDVTESQVAEMTKSFTSLLLELSSCRLQLDVEVDLYLVASLWKFVSEVIAFKKSIGSARTSRSMEVVELATSSSSRLLLQSSVVTWSNFLDLHASSNSATSHWAKVREHHVVVIDLSQMVFDGWTKKLTLLIESSLECVNEARNWITNTRPKLLSVAHTSGDVDLIPQIVNQLGSNNNRLNQLLNNLCILPVRFLEEAVLDSLGKWSRAVIGMLQSVAMALNSSDSTSYPTELLFRQQLSDVTMLWDGVLAASMQCTSTTTSATSVNALLPHWVKSCLFSPLSLDISTEESIQQTVSTSAIELLQKIESWRDSLAVLTYESESGNGIIEELENLRANVSVLGISVPDDVNRLELIISKGKDVEKRIWEQMRNIQDWHMKNSNASENGEFLTMVEKMQSILTDSRVAAVSRNLRNKLISYERTIEATDWSLNCWGHLDSHRHDGKSRQDQIRNAALSFIHSGSKSWSELESRLKAYSSAFEVDIETNKILCLDVVRDIGYANLRRFVYWRWLCSACSILHDHRASLMTLDNVMNQAMIVDGKYSLDIGQGERMNFYERDEVVFNSINSVSLDMKQLVRDTEALMSNLKSFLFSIVDTQVKSIDLAQTMGKHVTSALSNPITFQALDSFVCAVTSGEESSTGNVNPSATMAEFQSRLVAVERVADTYSGLISSSSTARDSNSRNDKLKIAELKTSIDLVLQLGFVMKKIMSRLMSARNADVVVLEPDDGRPKLKKLQVLCQKITPATIGDIATAPVIWLSLEFLRHIVHFANDWQLAAQGLFSSDSSSKSSKKSIHQVQNYESVYLSLPKMNQLEVALNQQVIKCIMLDEEVVLQEAMEQVDSWIRSTNDFIRSYSSDFSSAGVDEDDEIESLIVEEQLKGATNDDNDRTNTVMERYLSELGDLLSSGKQLGISVALILGVEWTWRTASQLNKVPLRFFLSDPSENIEIQAGMKRKRTRSDSRLQRRRSDETIDLDDRVEEEATAEGEVGYDASAESNLIMIGDAISVVAKLEGLSEVSGATFSSLVSLNVVEMRTKQIFSDEEVAIDLSRETFSNSANIRFRRLFLMLPNLKNYIRMTEVWQKDAEILIEGKKIDPSVDFATNLSRLNMKKSSLLIQPDAAIIDKLRQRVEDIERRSTKASMKKRPNMSSINVDEFDEDIEESVHDDDEDVDDNESSSYSSNDSDDDDDDRPKSKHAVDSVEQMPTRTRQKQKQDRSDPDYVFYEPKKNKKQTLSIRPDKMESLARLGKQEPKTVVVASDDKKKATKKNDLSMSISSSPATAATPSAGIDVDNDASTSTVVKLTSDLEDLRLSLVSAWLLAVGPKKSSAARNFQIGDLQAFALPLVNLHDYVAKLGQVFNKLHVPMSYDSDQSSKLSSLSRISSWINGPKLSTFMKSPPYLESIMSDVARKVCLEGNTIETSSTGKKDPTAMRYLVQKAFFSCFINGFNGCSLNANLAKAAVIAQEVEWELFQDFVQSKESNQGADKLSVALKGEYRNQFRTLKSNLEDPKNFELVWNIWSGKISSANFVRMSSDDLANPELKSQRKKTQEVLIIVDDAKSRSDAVMRQVHEGQFRFKELTSSGPVFAGPQSSVLKTVTVDMEEAITVTATKDNINKAPSSPPLVKQQEDPLPVSVRLAGRSASMNTADVSHLQSLIRLEPMEIVSFDEEQRDVVSARAIQHVSEAKPSPVVAHRAAVAKVDRLPDPGEMLVPMLNSEGQDKFKLTVPKLPTVTASPTSPCMIDNVVCQGLLLPVMEIKGRVIFANFHNFLTERMEKKSRNFACFTFTVNISTSTSSMTSSAVSPTEYEQFCDYFSNEQRVGLIQFDLKTQVYIIVPAMKHLVPILARLKDQDDAGKLYGVIIAQNPGPVALQTRHLTQASFQAAVPSSSSSSSSAMAVIEPAQEEEIDDVMRSKIVEVAVSVRKKGNAFLDLLKQRHQNGLSRLPFLFQGGAGHAYFVAELSKIS